MSRNIILLLIALVMCITGSCLGQEHPGMAMTSSDSPAMSQGGMSCPMMQGMDKDAKAGMMQKMKKMGNMQDMQKCRMECMLNGTMVATSDGGVVVLIGNKLTKYDKNLNMVKQTEIMLEPADMKKMMEEMKGK